MSTNINKMAMAATLEELSNAYFENPEGLERSHWDETSEYDGHKFFVHEGAFQEMLFECATNETLRVHLTRILIDKLAEEQGE